MESLEALRFVLSGSKDVTIETNVAFDGKRKLESDGNPSLAAEAGLSGKEEVQR